MHNTDIKYTHLAVKGDFSNIAKTWHKFLEAVNKLDAVTVLATLKHDFPNGGMSGTIIIGESHAAIHTWPEYGYAWIELATCGDPSALEQLETELSKHYQSVSCIASTEKLTFVNKRIGG